jgi:hypothetical protein
LSIRVKKADVATVYWKIMPVTSHTVAFDSSHPILFGALNDGGDKDKPYGNAPVADSTTAIHLVVTDTDNHVYGHGPNVTLDGISCEPGDPVISNGAD